MKEATFLGETSVLRGRLCFQKLNSDIYLGSLREGKNHITCELFFFLYMKATLNNWNKEIKGHYKVTQGWRIRERTAMKQIG